MNDQIQIRLCCKTNWLKIDRPLANMVLEIVWLTFPKIIAPTSLTIFWDRLLLAQRTREICWCSMPPFAAVLLFLKMFSLSVLCLRGQLNSTWRLEYLEVSGSRHSVQCRMWEHNETCLKAVNNWQWASGKQIHVPSSKIYLCNQCVHVGKKIEQSLTCPRLQKHA